MPAELHVDADLEFSVQLPGAGTVSGELSGEGNRLRLRVSDPLAFAGRRDSAAIRLVAEGLATSGLRLTVESDAGPIVTLGAPRTPWWQRWVTGSRHIRIERGAGLWSLARGRARATAGALPSARLAPPGTLWPPAPTLMRRPRVVTTTHDPAAGGNPRLIMAPHSAVWDGDQQEVFRLRRDVTTIGSDPASDVRLPGLEPLHAEVRHDDRDEFVLVRRSRPGDTLVNGEPVTTALLRTATRVQVGGWTMSFYREEYADHGRPYGGRVGGELGHQRPQPRRGTSSDWSVPEQHRPSGEQL